MWSYEEMLRDHGFTPKVEVVSIEVEPADAPTAEALEMNEAETVVAMEKVFYENDTPVVLTFNWVPARLLPQPVTSADAQAPIFDLLEEKAGILLAYYLSEIIPVTLSGHLATALQVPDPTPAISIDEVGYNADGEPLIHARSLFRDDLIRLGVMRRRTGG